MFRYSTVSLTVSLLSKMYSCYDSYLVYGIMESDRSMVLDDEWFSENYPNLGMFASDVVRNTMGNAVYGTSVGICEATGQVNPPTAESKAEVDRLYEILCQHCEVEGWPKPRLGYFLVISGDYEKDHSEYVPDYPA